MTGPLVTAESYPISWDGEDEISFKARLAVDPGRALLETWNGWLCPFLPKAEVERYIEFRDAIADDETFARCHFEEEVLILDPEYPEDEPVRTEPVLIDGRPFYPLGSWGWTWQMAPDGPDPDGSRYEAMYADANADAAEVTRAAAQEGTAS